MPGQKWEQFLLKFSPGIRGVWKALQKDWVRSLPETKLEPAAGLAAMAPAGGLPDPWQQAAENLIATSLLFMCNSLLRLSRSAFFLLGLAALLFLLASSTYPTPPQGLLSNTAVTLVVVVGLLTLVLIHRVERNELINTLLGTDANKTTWDFAFIFQAIVLLVVPIVVVVGNWFPEASEWLQKLVDPISRVLK